MSAVSLIRRNGQKKKKVAPWLSSPDLTFPVVKIQARSWCQVGLCKSRQNWVAVEKASCISVVQ